MRALLVAWSVLLAAVLSSFAEKPSPAPSREPVAASSLRVKLMDLGGALSNEGFKMRDRIWSGKIESGQPQRLAVNLFRGNHYWFCAAVDPEGRTVKVSLFQADGTPVTGVDHAEPGLAAVGVTAGTTGQYFVQIETTGGPASDFCLLYLFK